eukprot:3066079-Amphidinium_carterae.1
MAAAFPVGAVVLGLHDSNAYLAEEIKQLFSGPGEHHWSFTSNTEAPLPEQIPMPSLGLKAEKQKLLTL